MCVLRAEIPASPLLQAELGLSAETPLSSQSACSIELPPILTKQTWRTTLVPRNTTPTSQDPIPQQNLFHISTFAAFLLFSSQSQQEAPKMCPLISQRMLPPLETLRAQGEVPRVLSPADPAQSRPLHLVIPGLPTFSSGRAAIR